MYRLARLSAADLARPVDVPADVPTIDRPSRRMLRVVRRYRRLLAYSGRLDRKAYRTRRRPDLEWADLVRDELGDARRLLADAILIDLGRSVAAFQGYGILGRLLPGDGSALSVGYVEDSPRVSSTDGDLTLIDHALDDTPRLSHCVAC